MSRLHSTLRRIWLNNLNVIDAINNFTGTAKIAAAKLDISSLAGDGNSGILARTYLNVPAAGQVIMFTSQWTTNYDGDGDYNAIATGRYGGMNVNVRVEQAFDRVTIIPDQDGAKVRLTIVPLTAIM
jgi:hypothetical protein